MKNLLVVNNISYTVQLSDTMLGKKNEKTILKNISFNLPQGNILGIAGQSGSGKTTLVKILAGILEATDGEVILNHSANLQNKKTNPIQILFQNNGEILNPFRRIKEIVEETLKLRLKSTNDIHAEKVNVFNSVNFHHDLWNRKGFELSGGEQQRAALARLLAVKPELLILDEPFSAQDAESQLNLLKLFKKINTDYDITMICVAHNLKILKKLCDDVIIMYNGKIVEMGITEEVLKQPKHPYTKFLLKSENYDLLLEELKFDF